MKFLFFLFWFLLQFLTYQAKAQNPDIDLLKRINPNKHNGHIKYQQFLSNHTSTVNFGVPACLFAAGLIRKDSAFRAKAFITAGSILVADGLVLLSKVAVKRERPFRSYPDAVFKYGKGGSYAFPSGHTTEAFALATAVSLVFKKWYFVTPAFLYAGSVGYSRMYLGTHYPTDILGGAVLGTASAFLTFKANSWLRNHQKNRLPEK